MSLLVAMLLASAPAVNAYAVPTTWRTEADRQVTLDSFKGDQVVLAFVYTSCPGSCPLTTAKLKKLDAALTKAGKKPRFVVLSLDPEHDTPKAVADYRARFKLVGKKNWNVLVAPEEELRKITLLLDFRYSKNPDTQDILHDNKVFLLSEDGDLLDTMPSLDDAFADFAARVKVAAKAAR